MITNYGELKTAVANWLDRDDLTARVPEFIQLAECRIGRELRKRVAVAPLVVTSGDSSTGLPADCAELRSVRHDAPTAGRINHIGVTTPWGLDPYRESGAGTPVAAAIANNTLMWNRPADQNYTLEIVYFAGLNALSDSNTTNVELGDAPDLYLFAALCEAASFLEHDSRVPMWDTKYQAALTALNGARERAELGAGPVTMALPVVFG